MHTGLETGAAARNAAVRQLERSLPVQAPRGEDGLQASWLQGSGGAELLTWTDARSRVRRHEFTLLGDFFLWTRQGGLRTGTLRPQAESRMASVLFDARPSAERVERAAAALASYRGQDAGVLHLQRLLARAGQGLPPQADGPKEEGAPVPVGGPPARRGRRWWGALLLLTVLGLSALVALLS